MIFWSLCAVIWFQNIEKVLLQMTSGFLQLESTIDRKFWQHKHTTLLLYILVSILTCHATYKAKNMLNIRILGKLAFLAFTTIIFKFRN
jgi:hypothetical protein